MASLKMGEPPSRAAARPITLIFGNGSPYPEPHSGGESNKENPGELSPLDRRFGVLLLRPSCNRNLRRPTC